MSTTNRSETVTRNKSNKTKKTLDQLKDLQQIFSKVGSSTILGVKDMLLWVYNSVINFFAKCSMLVHFFVILIPVSLLFIFLIFYLHIRFYDELFRYNYYKGVKEEFLDGYITEIDDMQSTLEILIIKENYLDFENLLFFEVYYNELISLGLLDEEDYTFPGIADNSETLYTFYQKDGENCEYTIKSEEARKYCDNRNDSLKELAKIYYYMLPVINYGFKFMGVTINQTYLLAYEFDNSEDRNITGSELFFAFPKSNFSTQAYNFVVSHRYLNPMVSGGPYEHSEPKGDGTQYYEENFFKKKDYDFRKSVQIVNDSSFSKISLSHFNYELNGNITKSILSTLQLYINHGGKNYIINIIVAIQEKEIRNNAIEYSTFIYTREQNKSDNEVERYSDDSTFLISNQNFIEYSLTTLDNKYFHYGLYDNNNHFYTNGVFYDSFNFDLLADPLKYYQTVSGYNIDLKYLSSLYLYAKAYQNANKTDNYSKEDEELELDTYEDANKIQEICQNINLPKFVDYIKKEEDLDCWAEQNKFYFSDYKEEKLFNIYSLPYCSCLPLYCLKNYKTLKKDKYKFSEADYVTKINLPNKCQNKFTYYSNEEKDDKSTDFVFKLFNKKFTTSPENKYLRFQNDELKQLPGYYLFTVSEITSNATETFHLFYDKETKLKLIGIILGFLFVIFSLSIVIIYTHLRKITLIINEFKELYEKYIYNSSDTDLITSSVHNKANKNNKNESNQDKKNFEQNNDNENTPFMQNNNSLLAELYNNENSLIEELFVIYCKYYNISRNQIEKYYAGQEHETKYQLRMKMMMEQNELFKLLCMFCIYAPYFRLNLSLDYNTYKYSKLIKKFDKNILQMTNVDQEQIKLTRNILYELISTENIPDYGLIMNLNFKYISNINADNKENSIQNALFKNVFNKMKENENQNIENNDLIINKEDEKQNVKLVLKSKNEFIELLKNNFEADDYLDVKKLELSFNFFLINSYYKYMKQLANVNNKNNIQK